MTRSPRLRSVSFTSALVALLGVGCGAPEPRFGELSVSAAAPRATLSGRTTAASEPALALSPGCPGFVDPRVPEHRLHVEDGAPFVVAASSPTGPLALAVAGPSEVRCDSDEGSGHAPHVRLDQPGDYLVYVGALQQPAELGYELAVRPASEAGASGAAVADDTEVSVTVTSDPPGATVRTPEGEVLGTTPAMFVLPVRGDELGRERRFVLEMSGRPSVEVTGRMLGGSLVLHAPLPAPGLTPPTDPATPLVNNAAPTPTGPLVARSTGASQPIRDFSTIEQTLEVGTDCTIARAATRVDLTHSYLGDLRIALRSPAGTEVVLQNHSGTGRQTRELVYDWDARRGALHPLAGQPARGTWTLVVRDSVGADSGTLRGFALELTCADSAAGPTPTSPPSTSASAPTPTSPAPSRGTSTGARSRIPRGRVTPGTGLVDPWTPTTPTTPPSRSNGGSPF